MERMGAVALSERRQKSLPTIKREHALDGAGRDVTGTRHVCQIPERGSRGIGGGPRIRIGTIAVGRFGVAVGLRGVAVVLIVPDMNHPVLLEGHFIIYFQMVTEPQL